MVVLSRCSNFSLDGRCHQTVAEGCLLLQAMVATEMFEGINLQEMAVTTVKRWSWTDMHIIFIDMYANYFLGFLLSSAGVGRCRLSLSPSARPP